MSSLLLSTVPEFDRDRAVAFGAADMDLRIKCERDGGPV
jgi:hypothetical protein